MSLEEEIRKKFGKMQKVAIERLHPPRAPKYNSQNTEHSWISSEKSVEETIEQFDSANYKVGTESTDSQLGIDPFVWLSSNHSFQMVMYEFMKKFAPGLEKIKTRGTKKVLKNSFSKARQDLMKELKEVLEMRKK